MALTKAIVFKGIPIPVAYIEIVDWVASKPLNYLNVQVNVYASSAKTDVLYSKLYEYPYEVPPVNPVAFLYEKIAQEEDLIGAVRIDL